MNRLFRSMSLKIRAFACPQCLAWLYFCCSSPSWPSLIWCSRCGDQLTWVTEGPFVMVSSPAHWALLHERCKSSTSEEKPPKSFHGCNHPAARGSRGPRQLLYSLLGAAQAAAVGGVLLAAKCPGSPAPCSTLRQILQAQVLQVPWRYCKAIWTWSPGNQLKVALLELGERTR